MIKLADDEHLTPIGIGLKHFVQRCMLSGYKRWHKDRWSIDLAYWSITWGRSLGRFYVDSCKLRLMPEPHPYLAYGGAKRLFWWKI